MKMNRLFPERLRQATFFLLLMLLSPLVASAQSSINADVNGDGEVTIADVNLTIDVILLGTSDASADVNGDGEVTIADVNAVIDAILNKPLVQIYSTIIVNTVDGGTVEYLIDDKTKVRLAKPYLIINTDGMVMTYHLDDMAQLRYGQRMVTTGIGILRDYDLPTVGTVFLDNLNDNTLVEVISTDGRVIMRQRVSGTVEVSLGSEPAGEYVVKAGSQTFNIVKQ